MLVALSLVQVSIADDCAAEGDFAYLCGPISAEDLVLIPETNWLIASGFGDGASMYLIDTEHKSWQEFYPDAALDTAHDQVRYAACPGPVDPGAFVAHGLHIRPGDDGHSTLYVVGHGAREAIEVFDVQVSSVTPALTWIGCVLTPDGLEANSVAAFADGSLIASIPLTEGASLNNLLDEIATGAVYAWEPGDATFTPIAGTEMGYANGVEVSVDGDEFYVASSSHMRVYAFSNSNPAELLRESERFAIIPDNLHMSVNGGLLTAGLKIDDPKCGDLSQAVSFDLEAFATCHRGFVVLEVDPETLQTKVRAQSAAQARFSNVTMAVEVNDELWIGTFGGDRIAYTDAR